MENVVFDGRNISQRQYQNRTFPNRVHKKNIFRKMSKNGWEWVRGEVGTADLDSRKGETLGLRLPERGNLQT